MISVVLVVVVAVAVSSPVSVSSMPEHAKRYRYNDNEISQHHAVSRAGKMICDLANSKAGLLACNYLFSFILPAQHTLKQTANTRTKLNRK